MVKRTRFVLLEVQLHDLMFAVRVSLQQAMVKAKAKFLPSATKLRRLCFHRHLFVHRGVCLVLGGLLRGGLLQEASALGRGVWSQGGLYPSMHWGRPPPRRDGYCCGRYASYWNAFLFFEVCRQSDVEQNSWISIQNLTKMIRSSFRFVIIIYWK